MQENVRIIEQHCIENELVSHINESNLPSSCYIEIESEKYFSRITMWEKGDCDLEILSVEFQTLLFWKHILINNKLINAFQEFSEFMSILTE